MLNGLDVKQLNEFSDIFREEQRRVHQIVENLESLYLQMELEGSMELLEMRKIINSFKDELRVISQKERAIENITEGFKAYAQESLDDALAAMEQLKQYK